GVGDGDVVHVTEAQRGGGSAADGERALVHAGEGAFFDIAIEIEIAVDGDDGCVEGAEVEKTGDAGEWNRAGTALRGDGDGGGVAGAVEAEADIAASGVDNLTGAGA